MIRTIAASTIALSLIGGAAEAQQSMPPAAQAQLPTPPAAAKDDPACPPAVTAGVTTGMQMMQSMMAAMAKFQGAATQSQDGTHETKKTQ